MNRTELIKAWKAEEQIAHIHGWDFSHINDRYTEQDDLSWEYAQVIRQYLKEEDALLDIDTGGGEFLMTLGHAPERTSATEGYAPNVDLCRETLLPKGYDFREADDCRKLPFEDEKFDMVINRHGDFDCRELHRILKPGGLFITQQVGEHNDRELVELLLPGTPRPFPGMNLTEQTQKFRQAGFEILRGEEAYRPIRFFDIGALVWFARIIEWEFPGFSVDGCLDELLEAQEILDKSGCVDGTIHRYLIVARK